MTLGLEGHPLHYAEVQHLRMGAHLLQELQTRDDTVGQVSQAVAAVGSPQRSTLIGVPRCAPFAASPRR